MLEVVGRDAYGPLSPPALTWQSSPIMAQATECAVSRMEDVAMKITRQRSSVHLSVFVLGALFSVAGALPVFAQADDTALKNALCGLRCRCRS